MKLVPQKPTDAFHVPNDGWVKFDYNPETQQTKWLKIDDDGKATVRITVPQNVINQTLRQNAELDRDWSGWNGKDVGLVASIPEQVHTHLIKQCGFDAKAGGQYDRKKYVKLLNDIDYKKLRTGGGKL